MKRSLILIVLTMLFQFCTGPKSEPEFIIQNESNILLDSVVIGASKRNPSIISNIGRNEKAYGKIIFDDDIMGDGAYFIEVYCKNKSPRFQVFGYYTNGASLDNKFRIAVYKDSIVINSSQY